MGSNWHKINVSIYERLRMPRKVKKQVFGYRMSGCELRRMLKSIRLGDPIKTMYERRVIYPSAFCPKCGHSEYHGTGNKTKYPEHWEYFYCNRCYNTVAGIDNSPFYHVLEFPEYNFILPF